MIFCIAYAVVNYIDVNYNSLFTVNQFISS